MQSLAIFRFSSKGNLGENKRLWKIIFIFIFTISRAPSEALLMTCYGCISRDLNNRDLKLEGGSLLPFFGQGGSRAGLELVPHLERVLRSLTAKEKKKKKKALVWTLHYKH